MVIGSCVTSSLPVLLIPGIYLRVSSVTDPVDETARLRADDLIDLLVV
jgi:hypothetical protein